MYGSMCKYIELCLILILVLIFLQIACGNSKVIILMWCRELGKCADGSWVNIGYYNTLLSMGFSKKVTHHVFVLNFASIPNLLFHCLLVKLTPKTSKIRNCIGISIKMECIFCIRLLFCNMFSPN